MSKVIVRAHQIGISNTASQNFTLQTPTVPDGTMKLARGVPDATTQDIFTVGTDGKVAFNQGIVGLEASRASGGFQKLPSGLILQWGQATVSPGNGGNQFSLPIAWPTGIALAGFATSLGPAYSGGEFGISFPNGNSIYLYSATTNGPQTVCWLAIGY